MMRTSVNKAFTLALGVAVGTVLSRLLRRGRVRLHNVKLYYWPATGRAETVRLLLAECGVAFEDVAFSKPRDDVQIYSSASSFNEVRTSAAAKAFFERCRALGGNVTTNVPMLEADGAYYTQSTALYRLAAREAGLYPSDSEGGYIVDSVLAHCEDAFPLCYSALFGRNNVTRASLANELVPQHLGNLERLLGLHGGLWFTGTFSLADVRVADVCMHLFDKALPGCLAPFPRLASLVERVKARPRIQAYLASEQYAKTDKFQPLA